MATKGEILRQLRGRLNLWVSGEELSRSLSVSRMAVSKQIGNLRKDGYDIVSSPKKGYLLRKAPDLVYANEIEPELKTSVFGKVGIVYLEEAGSTNLVARKAAEEGAPEGTLVVAEAQTKGRGRKGRIWHSPAFAGIYMSFVLRPTLPPHETPVVTLMTAVALAEAVRNLTGLTPNIKWPNDLLIGKKKLAGILTEIVAQPDSVDYVIVGAGINVNTTPKMFGPEIKDFATSLYMETGKKFRRAELIAGFLFEFEKYYEMFKSRRFDFIVESWRDLADIVGRNIKVDVLGRIYEGEVVAVESDGALVIREEGGAERRLLSGDVVLEDAI